MLSCDLTTAFFERLIRPKTLVSVLKRITLESIDMHCQLKTTMISLSSHNGKRFLDGNEVLLEILHAMRLEHDCYSFEKVKPFKENFVVICHISPTRFLKFGQIDSAISPSDALLTLRLLALPQLLSFLRVFYLKTLLRRIIKDNVVMTKRFLVFDKAIEIDENLN